MRSPILPFLTLLLLLALPACDKAAPKSPAVDQRTAKARISNDRRLKRACGSEETYSRLKAFAFDEAGRIRRSASPLLDRVAASSTLRMENPVAKSRDEALNVTVCEGHLILELPPGTQDAFDGDRRLEADIEYSAQEAVDGSGLVYQMKGAEPIIYRLAALALPTGRAQSPPVIAQLPPEPVTMPQAPPPAAPRVEAAPARLTPPDLMPPPPPRRREPPPSVEPIEQVTRTEAPVAPEPRVVSARPSFNCRAAHSRVERMICDDAALATADRRMSSAFYAALANGNGVTRSELRRTRDRFLSFRERCGNQACVLQAYDDRVAEIRDIQSGR